MNEKYVFYGRRVIHDGTGKKGVIVSEPGSDAAKVFVLFDGAEKAIPVHPDQLEFMEEAA